MRHLILIAICTILISSCDNDSADSDLSSNSPEIPINDSIDVNSDNIIDFVIYYRELATNDELSSGGSIIGAIRPLNQNQLLCSSSGSYIFLDINGTIKKESNYSSDWVGYSADLISIDRDSKKWDRTWTVVTNQLFYNFLAYKIKVNDSEWIGWICLDFNTETGEISITDRDISDGDELIIQKRITN